VWNSLPATLRQITNYGQFRQHLKTHLFGAWKSQRIVTLDYCALYQYSYLLASTDAAGRCVMQTMKNNINRVQKHVAGLVSVGEFLQSCFSWKSKIRTVVAFAVRYGPLSIDVFTTLTVILIVISFPLPTLFFIPGLKPSFSANPSHCSLSFSSSGLTT